MAKGKGKAMAPGAEQPSLLTALETALQTALQTMLEDKTIYIYVDNNGNFTYVPSHYRASHDEKIKFVCLNSPTFEVVFKDGTPGDKLYLSDQDPVLTITADDYSAYRVYHYGAAVATTGRDRRPRVFLDAGCGDIGVGK